MFAQLSNPGRREEAAVFATAISQVHARVGGWARKCRMVPTREGIRSGRPAEFMAPGRSGRRPVGSGRGLDLTPVAPATSSRWLLVGIGDALRLGQTRCQDPHELCRRLHPQPSIGRSLGGASPSSATGRAGGRPPSPIRRRGPPRPPRPHGPWRARRGGMGVWSCALEPVAGFWRLGEAHRDRKVVGGGAIPLAPTSYAAPRSAGGRCALPMASIPRADTSRSPEPAAPATADCRSAGSRSRPGRPSTDCADRGPPARRSGRSTAVV